ncbi:MAG: site-specific integrase [Shewanella sp.]|jgi:integrase|uniref:site-specific integrase n=1 Tax=Shewanella sp. TaxID=50422 RepID=UPI00300236FC
MNVKVEIYRDTSGNPFPIIIKNGVFPACLYMNAYLNGNHNSSRSKSYKIQSSQTPALNTRIKYAYELKLIYLHFTSKNINLVQRVSSAEFLTISELEEFVRLCKLYAVNEHTEKTNIINLTDTRIRNAIYATANSQAQVSAHTFRQRLIRLKSYIEYLYLFHHEQSSINLNVQMDDKLRVFQLYMNRLISGIRKDNTETKDPLTSIIPAEKFFKLLEIIQASSPRNPFKLSRLRNQIIMQIMIDTGVRVGAILKIKISDLIDDWDNPRFLLTKTPNDTTDKRSNPAKNKTKPLSVSISSDLMKLLKLYIDTIRVVHSKSLEHDFIFISEKGISSGQPITYEGIHKVVDKFGKTISIKLHAHKLRHKWNEIFTVKAELAGYDPAQINDMRRYCMGWSANSKMDLIYNEFMHAVKSAELSAKNQNKSVPVLRNSNE